MERWGKMIAQWQEAPEAEIVRPHVPGVYKRNQGGWVTSVWSSVDKRLKQIYSGKDWHGAVAAKKEWDEKIKNNTENQ